MVKSIVDEYFYDCAYVVTGDEAPIELRQYLANIILEHKERFEGLPMDWQHSYFLNLHSIMPIFDFQISFVIALAA